MLGCDGSRMFRQVVLPAALPSIFNGLRLGHGFAWILIVVGEMTGVPTGLGSVIMDGRTLSRTDLVVSGMILIGIAGFICDPVIVAINNRVLRWSREVALEAPRIGHLRNHAAVSDPRCVKWRRSSERSTAHRSLLTGRVSAIVVHFFDVDVTKSQRSSNTHSSPWKGLSGR
jgi:hypothetical protein